MRVVEPVDLTRSRLAAQAECSCWPCHGQLGAIVQSSLRSSQAPLLGFIVVCREKWGCMFSSSLTSSLCCTTDTGLEDPRPGAGSSCLSPYTSSCVSRLWGPAIEHLYPKRLQDGAAVSLSFLLVYVSGQVMARAPLREWRMGREGSKLVDGGALQHIRFTHATDVGC